KLELALTNDLYRERVVAETNLGWALYKSGQADKGIQRIQAALALSPRYCLGWRQLGTIQGERGNLEAAAEAFQKYAATCPDAADAHLQLGKLFARQGKAPDARGYRPSPGAHGPPASAFPVRSNRSSASRPCSTSGPARSYGCCARHRSSKHTPACARTCTASRTPDMPPSCSTI